MKSDDPAPPYPLSRLIHGVPLSCSALLMRHGHRPPITDPKIAESVLLSPQGLENARTLGAELLTQYPPTAIFHSPIPRCQQTAESAMHTLAPHSPSTLFKGARSLLGTKYLPNPPKSYLWSKEQKLDSLGFVSLWLNNKLDRSLADDPQQAAWKILTFLWESQQLSPGFQLHCSHDWNILLMVSVFMGIVPEESIWPGFLEGMVVSFSTPTIQFKYRDHTTSMPWPTSWPTHADSNPKVTPTT